MSISTTRDGTAAVVRLTGRLDGEEALHMAETLEHLLHEGRRSVTLDMSGVTYLSSPRHAGTSAGAPGIRLGPW